MKANSKKGLARKGSTYKTVTILKNNGIARDANEKVTTTIVKRNIQPRMGEMSTIDYLESQFKQ